MKKLLAALCLLLAGCGGEKVQGAPAPGDVVNVPAFEWNVVDRTTLRQVYEDAGMEIQEGARLYGFVGRRGNANVIYTTSPNYVDDAVTCTLGHEVLHLAIGDYHE